MLVRYVGRCDLALLSPEFAVQYYALELSVAVLPHDTITIEFASQVRRIRSRLTVSKNLEDLMILGIGWMLTNCKGSIYLLDTASEVRAEMPVMGLLFGSLSLPRGSIASLLAQSARLLDMLSRAHAEMLVYEGGPLVVFFYVSRPHVGVAPLLARLAHLLRKPLRVHPVMQVDQYGLQLIFSPLSRPRVRVARLLA